MAALLCGLLNRSLRVQATGAMTGTALAARLLAPNTLPTGAAVAAGQVNFNQSANALTVSQGSNKAIVNWNSFNIGSAASVNFVQPSATSAILNRVTGNDPSSLLGTLSSNGKVWLIHPAGVMMGQGARIDVTGFVASALNVRDNDFLAGRLNFAAGTTAGMVQNYGGGMDNFGGSSRTSGTKFLDASEVVLRPRSQIKVDLFSFDRLKPEGDGFSLNLLKGGMHAVTGMIGKRNREAVQFTTLTATIGIRGTVLGALICEAGCPGV